MEKIVLEHQPVAVKVFVTQFKRHIEFLRNVFPLT